MDILKNETFFSELKECVLNGDIERCGDWDEVLTVANTLQDVIDNIGESDFCFGITWFITNYHCCDEHKEEITEVIKSMSDSVGVHRYYYLLNMV